MRIWMLALPLIAGCDFLTVDTSIDDACVSFDDKVVDAASGTTLERSFSYSDLSVLDGFVALDADVTQLDVTLTAVAGVRDLSFLDGVRVTLQSGALPPLDVIDCQGGACASSDTSTALSETAPPNLTDYALTGTVTVKVTLTGAHLPTQPWTADVKVCLSGQARASVGI